MGSGPQVEIRVRLITRSDCVVSLGALVTSLNQMYGTGPRGAVIHNNCDGCIPCIRRMINTVTKSLVVV